MITVTLHNKSYKQTYNNPNGLNYKLKRFNNTSNNLLTITFPIMSVSRAHYKKTKNTLGPDYVIRTRLLEIFETQNPDSFDMTFLVFSLMSKVSLLTII